MVYICGAYVYVYKVYLNGRHPRDKDKPRGRVRVMYYYCTIKTVL